MNKKRATLILTGLIIFNFPGICSADSTSNLEEQIKIMQQQMQEEKNQMEIMQKKIEKLEAKKAPGTEKENNIEERVTEVEKKLKNPQFVRIGHGEIKLHGYVQSYYTWYEDDSVNDTFDIRRIFVFLDGRVSEYFVYRVLVDAGASSNILRDAYIKFTPFSYANIKAGQFKIPFSEEWITSSALIDTIQRAKVVTTLTYDRDIGVMLDGKLFDDKLYYATGVFNGAGRNRSDNNDNKDFIGRVIFSPFKEGKNLLNGLSFAGSSQIGKQPENGTAKGYRYRYDAMTKYRYDKFKFQSEYIFQKQEQTDGSDIDSEGWYVTATYKLISSLQGVLKYEQYDPNTDTDKDREDILTIGVNCFFNEYTKLQANYRLKDEQTEKNNDEFLLQIQMKF